MFEGTVEVAVVHGDEDAAEFELEFEFSSNSCCTCNISTYSSRLLCADMGFGRLSVNLKLTDSLCTKLIFI